MLEIKGLTKDYGSNRALDGFSFTFKEGICALLGPNGSGKSTLMNLLTDNIKRTSGEILYNGIDILDSGRDYRSIVGYMPQNAGIYPTFTCEEYMLYIAALKGLETAEAEKQTDALLETVELRDVKRSKTRTLSGGMKQRLLLAQAFLGDPKLVILDEPTAGLDPRQRIAVRSFISSNAFDKTIIYATHIVADIDSIANECILLKKGVIAAHGTPERIAENAKGFVWNVVCGKEQSQELAKKCTTVNMRAVGDTVEMRLISESQPMPDSMSAEPQLQDAYLYVFGTGESGG